MLSVPKSKFNPGIFSMDLYRIQRIQSSEMEMASVFEAFDYPKIGARSCEDPPERCIYCDDADCDRHTPEKADPGLPRCPCCGDIDCDRHWPEDENPGGPARED